MAIGETVCVRNNGLKHEKGMERSIAYRKVTNINVQHHSLVAVNDQAFMDTFMVSHVPFYYFFYLFSFNANLML